MKKSTPKKKSDSKTFAKKVVASLPEHTNENLKRYIGVVSEHFGDQVSAVAEQFLGLNEKVDDINQKLDSHTETIGGIKEDIEIIKSNIEILKSGMRMKVDYQDFEALEKRVRLVESKLHR